MSTDTGHTPEAPRSHVRRSRQLLLVCALGSLTLHLAVLAALPGFMSDSPSLPARVLSVVLLGAEPPQPLPMAPPETEHKLEAPKRKQTDSLPKQGATPIPSVPEQRPLTVSALRPAAEPAFTVPVQPVEPRASAPEPKPPAVATTPKAAAPATPPVFNASYLRNPPPAYPLLARRNGEQGTVTLKVLVARDGTPASVSVERTSGSAHLDRAALDTVRTWRFVPAREGSEPVEAWVLVPIVFRLEGAS